MKNNHQNPWRSSGSPTTYVAAENLSNHKNELTSFKYSEFRSWPKMEPFNRPCCKKEFHTSLQYRWDLMQVQLVWNTQKRSSSDAGKLDSSKLIRVRLRLVVAQYWFYIKAFESWGNFHLRNINLKTWEGFRSTWYPNMFWGTLWFSRRFIIALQTWLTSFCKRYAEFELEEILILRVSCPSRST